MTVLQWLGPLAGLLGVLLGFALGQWDARRRRHEEAAGARILLRLEIDDNLDEVRRYRAEAADRSLEEMLPPAWETAAWISQLPRLPAALSAVELERTRRFYSRLALLAEHHQRARTAADDPLIQAREVGAAEELVQALVRDGNPLSSRHHDAPHRRWPAPRWAAGPSASRAGIAGDRGRMAR